MSLNEIGNYFEYFFEGQTINHKLSKTIFESDNNLFSLITMNFHPVHTNQFYAENNQHKQKNYFFGKVFTYLV